MSNLALNINPEEVALEPATSEQAHDVIAKAGQIVAITTDVHLAVAGEVGKVLREMRKTIEEFFKPIKQAQDAAKKVILDKEKAELAPILEAIDRLNRMSSAYLTEKERQRQEEERRLRMIEEERARKEQEKLLAQAAKAEDKGQTAKAEALLDKAEDVYAAPVHVAASGPLRTETATVSSSKDLVVEVVDLKAFVTALVEQGSNSFDALLQVKPAALKAWAKSNGVKKMPGLAITEQVKARVL